MKYVNREINDMRVWPKLGDTRKNSQTHVQEIQKKTIKVIKNTLVQTVWANAIKNNKKQKSSNERNYLSWYMNIVHKFTYCA